MENIDGLFDLDSEGDVDTGRLFDLDLDVSWAISKVVFNKESEFDGKVLTEDEIKKYRARIINGIKDVMKDYSADEIAWYIQTLCTSTTNSDVHEAFMRSRVQHAMKKVFDGIKKHE